jgi:hypothetical protein
VVDDAHQLVGRPTLHERLADDASERPLFDGAGERLSVQFRISALRGVIRDLSRLPRAAKHPAV